METTTYPDAVETPALVERSAGVQRLLAQFRPVLREPLPRAELRAEGIVAVAFLAVAVPLAVLAPQHGSHSPALILLFMLVFALTTKVEFDLGSGYCVPTQLVLVPMLFVLPAAWVPLLVVGSLLGGRALEFARGTRHPLRAVAALGDTWYAVGPAAVFAYAGLTAPRWSDWPLLVAALGAQVTCDLVASAAREWLRTGEPPRLPVRLLGQVYFVDFCLSPIGLAVAFASRGRPVAVLMTLPLSALLMFFARERQARMRSALELSRAFRGTALLLGDVVEADDEYTGLHSRDVVDLCMAVGPRLGLDEDQLRRLEFTALLHDVGKIAIPKEIINKPGKLTDEERAVIETHTIEGEAMLERVGGLLGQVGRLVRSCHERYDGLGYPDGLVGEAIPVEARIVCCCDAFNAMTTDRPYRKALSLGEALAELRAHRGTQFDPGVVDCLLELHADALGGADAARELASAV
ncbi:MAG TPA: HD domain-containing phosphohydrolase [Solirubrobacteraceae bacterium]|nr:HD domain-containing phosphohydrolase [Solirubrobacteraceae bacterium]